MTMSYFGNPNYLETESEKKRNKCRRKYRSLKQRVVALVIENAALCDEVAKVQETIVVLKEERRFLLRKLLEYEQDPEISHPLHSSKSSSSHHTNGPQSKKRKREEDFIK